MRRVVPPPEPQPVAAGVPQPRGRLTTPLSIALGCLIVATMAAAVAIHRPGTDSGTPSPRAITPAARTTVSPAHAISEPRAQPLGLRPSAEASAGSRAWWRALRKAITATFPFRVPPQLRAPRPAEAIPSLYGDGLACSIGCRPSGALDGWPLRPFHRQHALRAGLNELRPDSLHVGVDIQARDGAGVYAVQPGYARVLAPSGPDARVQVGNYIYWHVTPLVQTGELVIPYKTPLGRVMGGYGHIALSELDRAGRYVNPLRPDGRVLAPWRDRYPPVIGRPAIGSDGSAVVDAFDPQSFVVRTTYRTPVLAPAAIAYRLYFWSGQPATPLEFSFRGTHLLAWAARNDLFAPGARAPGFECFARRWLCRPDWRYWLAGGLAPPLPASLPAGRYRLTVYAWDWADNRSALDTIVWKSPDRWHPRGRVPAQPPPDGSGLRLSDLHPLGLRAVGVSHTAPISR